MMLDVNTLYTVTILVMALLGLLLILVWLQNRGMRALVWWGAAYLVGGMSVWLLGERGSVSDLMSIDLANALLFVACGLTWSGACGRRSVRWFPTPHSRLPAIAGGICPTTRSDCGRWSRRSRDTDAA